MSSLSAILLDEDYYAFIQAGKGVVDGLAVASPERLIPLKALAWMNLSARKADGEKVDGRHIRKHRNDVFRLYRVIDPDTEVAMPEVVRADMTRFVSMIEEQQSVDLKQLGLKGTTHPDVLADLKRIYGLDS